MSTSAIALSLADAAPVWAADSTAEAKVEAGADSAVQAGSEVGDDIIVTAQRREENILQVPISITSLSPELMDRQGIRQIDDIARLTPNLRFNRNPGVSGQTGANIAIRGISSSVGSATTAIYLDDTPIQVRNIGYWGGNPYPRVFDLDRVEVLRGPQGTQFGAGAEGGAVRFITPQPQFGALTAYGRTEVATTKNGAASYEGGFAVGGGVSDTLAVRASAWYRRDGGYIDRVDPATRSVIKRDINSQDTIVTRVALSWRPIEQLTITPSIFYQRVEADGRNQYWEQFSDLKDADYKTGIYNREPVTDSFSLPALKVEYDFGGVVLISNTSRLDRKVDQVLDYATFLSANRTGNAFGFYANKDTSNAAAAQTLKQVNFTQEVRLQSTDANAFFAWAIGAYYSKAQQDSTNLSQSGRRPGVISSGFPQYLGRYNLFSDIHAVDKQIAGFASVDLKPLEGLKLSFGARVTQNEFSFVEVRDGPVNSGTRTTSGAGQKATSFTPRVAASYQFDQNSMLYASASKGFRQGGAQSPVDPAFCAKDLQALGLNSSPTTYQSDSLWSYEVGSKNSLFGGKVRVDANAYLVKWKNIQQAVRLPTCQYDFIGNLGSATGKGVDISIAVKPVAGLQVGANVGFNDITYDSDLNINGALIHKEGDRFGGPKWTGSVFGQYEQEVAPDSTGYFRADYSFASVSPMQNPASVTYDPNLAALPGTDYLSLRAGLRKGVVDFSLFVNNVTNSSDPLSRGHDTIPSTLFYVESYRPRTIGATVQVRY